MPVVGGQLHAKASKESPNGKERLLAMPVQSWAPLSAAHSAPHGYELDLVCAPRLVRSQKTAFSKDSPCQRSMFSVLFLYLNPTGSIISRNHNDTYNNKKNY